MKKMLILIMVLSFGFSTLFAENYPYGFTYAELEKKIIEIEHSETKDIMSPDAKFFIGYTYKKYKKKYKIELGKIIKRGFDFDPQGKKYSFIIIRVPDYKVDAKISSYHHDNQFYFSVGKFNLKNNTFIATAGASRGIYVKLEHRGYSERGNRTIVSVF